MSRLAATLAKLETNQDAIRTGGDRTNRVSAFAMLTILLSWMMGACCPRQSRWARQQPGIYQDAHTKQREDA